MECPHCKKQVAIPQNVLLNVEMYSPHTAILSLPCCGKAVIVTRQISFSIRKYSGCETEDDWGNKIAK